MSAVQMGSGHVYSSTLPCLVLSDAEESFLEEDGSGHSCVIGSEIYLDVNYLHYLYDARLGITSCMRACRVWSAPYDGADPPPEEYQPSALEEQGVRGRHAQAGPKRPPQQQPPLRPCHPCPPQNTEPPSVYQLELEWDDSYDACPVQTTETAFESKLSPPPAVEPPRHIQEMRRTAIMLVKGSYIEESDFQDDVMVYNLIAKKDARDAVEGDKRKPNGMESEETRSDFTEKEALLRNGLSLTPQSAVTDDNSKNSSGHKVKGQPDCNSNLQSPNNTTELGDDLLAQYEELIRTLSVEAGGGGSPVKVDRELRNPIITDMEEEQEMDFSAFSAEAPEPEKLHTAFGTKLRSGSRSHSVPFTGELRVEQKRLCGTHDVCLQCG